MRNKANYTTSHKPIHGFTLIELLVVISIIALLLSILMPALGRARDSARATVCQTHARQWHIISNLYGMDNKDRFPGSSLAGYVEGAGAGNHGHWWMMPLRPYYQDPRIRLCPNATVTPDIIFYGDDKPSNHAWATPVPANFPRDEVFYRVQNQDVILGSLAPNGWFIDISDGRTPWGGSDLSPYWMNFSSVRQPDNVPLFLDCAWVDGWPLHTDRPQNPEQNTSRFTGAHMQRFNVNRHRGFINGVFVDGSVRRVSLKGLWRLKWHREFSFDPNSNRLVDPAATFWPEWMKGLPD